MQDNTYTAAQVAELIETVRALAAALDVTPDDLRGVAPVETAEAGV